MGNQVQYLVAACSQLGLEIDPAFEVTLGGISLVVPARVALLGARNGMLVFNEVSAFWPHLADAILEAHFAFTCYEDNDRDDFELESYIKMFTDWGWSGDPATKPSWMINS